MPSAKRRDRVASALKELASRIILYELRDPRLGFVTVTRAEVSSDLRSAKVMVSVMGDDKKQALTMRALGHARGYIQRGVAKELNLRSALELSFHLDDGIKKSIRLSQILREVAENGQ